MSTLTEVPMVRHTDGRAVFVVLPIAEYKTLLAQARAARIQAEAVIPREVVCLMVEGTSAARAWREHLGLTQAEVARRMDISSAALAQMEVAARPRKATRGKQATAMGLDVEQLVSV